MLYFLYKTICLTTGKYYLGRHSTIKSIENDNYLGSGLWIKKAIKVYGRNNFKREIISSHENQEELILAEKILITQEILKDPLCTNMDEGGSGRNMPEEIQRVLKNKNPNLLKDAGKRGGSANWKITKIKMKLDPNFKIEFCKKLEKARIAYKERLESDIEYKKRSEISL